MSKGGGHFRSPLGPWDNLDDYDAHRLAIMEMIRSAIEGVGPSDDVTLSFTATEWDLIEWSLWVLPDRFQRQRSLDRVRERYLEAAEILAGKKDAAAYKKALDALGLPEEGFEKYPSNLLRYYVALITESEPIELPTPEGLIFDDPTAVRGFDCPLTPIEAVKELAKLYAAGTPVACRKKLERLCDELGTDDPDAARRIRATLPAPSELVT